MALHGRVGQFRGDPPLAWWVRMELSIPQTIPVPEWPISANHSPTRLCLGHVGQRQGVFFAALAPEPAAFSSACAVALGSLSSRSLAVLANSVLPCSLITRSYVSRARSNSSALA